MTDDTHPEAREFTMSQYASKDDMIGAMRKRIAELESELEAVGAGGVSGPLVGIAAPPAAQAEGWRPISTAPRDGTEVLADTSGLGRVVVYWDDEESQWGTGLGYLDRGAPTHWMPLPPPPTSAEGVEHG
jgi:hypothetical protein